MIEIIGQEGSSEHFAAKAIYETLKKTWPGIENSDKSEDHIKIIVGAKLSGHKVSDIDVIIVGLVRSKKYFVPKVILRDADGQKIIGAKIRLKSFLAAIEVKDHSAELMKIEAGGVSVSYGGRWKNATEQNEAQRYALVEYFQESNSVRPWVYRCLILRGIPDLPQHRGKIQPSGGAVSNNFNATTLFSAMISVNGLQKHKDEYVLSSGSVATIEKVLDDSLFLPLVPSVLDRRRMDRIAARPSEAQELAQYIGEKRVHLRGNGGTGKTILLLQTAYEAYSRQGKRCLVLTYNTALAADIQRTLSLMGIPSEAEAGGIAVRTVISFMYSWFHKLGLNDEAEVDRENYQSKCLEALKYLREEVVSTEDIEQIKSDNPIYFDHDAILIDEAQDWPQIEADLLSQLYGGNRISLADGISQLVRGAPTDWKSSVVGQPKLGERYLDTGLRMKSGISHFINSFAQEVGVQWHVNPSEEAAGGRVIVKIGNYSDHEELHKQILSDALSAGNMPIDLLHCVPSSEVLVKDNRRSSTLAATFAKNSWEVWDAVDEGVRRNFPRSANAMRIVQYESCRGLEGWVTVLDGLDEFWQAKKELALRELTTTESGVLDVNAAAEAIAWRWCLIPLTRPIDTLIITVRDKDSAVYQPLKSLLKKLPDIVSQ